MARRNLTRWLPAAFIAVLILVYALSNVTDLAWWIGFALICALFLTWLGALVIGWCLYQYEQQQAAQMTQAEWWQARLQLIDTTYQVNGGGRQWITLRPVRQLLPQMSTVVFNELIAHWRAAGYLEVSATKNANETDYRAWRTTAWNPAARRMRLTHRGQALHEHYQKIGDLRRAITDFQNRDKAPHYNVTIHSAGQVNIDPKTVNNIRSHIQSIGQDGDREVARILNELTNAAMQSGFEDGQLAQILDAIEDVSEGAKTNPRERKLPRIMRAIEYIGSAATTTTALGKVWTEYGHVVEQLFRVP